MSWAWDPKAVRALLCVALGGTIASACATKPHAVTAATPAPATPPTGPGDALGEEPGEATDDGAESPEEGASIAAEEPAPVGPCGEGMALVETIAAEGARARRYCIDKYEAALVEVLPDGTERPYAHYATVDGHVVRAVSHAGVFPQGFISEVQADDACKASSKRLCSHDEWKTACMGPSRTTFPYGNARRAGTCHDTGKSAVVAVFGAKAVAESPVSPIIAKANAPRTASLPAGPASASTSRTTTSATAKSTKRAHATKGRAASTTHPRATSRTAKAEAKASTPKKSTAAAHGRKPGKKSEKPQSVDQGVWTRLNDPALGQVEGALAKAGDHAECVNGYGLYDMVGNLHEWVAGDPATVNGTFAGGYYLDTTINGDGCNYRTQAHAHDYHDYSTGFRCCKDPE